MRKMQNGPLTGNRAKAKGSNRLRLDCRLLSNLVRNRMLPRIPIDTFTNLTLGSKAKAMID